MVTKILISRLHVRNLFWRPSHNLSGQWLSCRRSDFFQR